MYYYGLYESSSWGGYHPYKEKLRRSTFHKALTVIGDELKDGELILSTNVVYENNHGLSGPNLYLRNIWEEEGRIDIVYFECIIYSNQWSDCLFDKKEKNLHEVRRYKIFRIEIDSDIVIDPSENWYQMQNSDEDEY